MKKLSAQIGRIPSDQMADGFTTLEARSFALDTDVTKEAAPLYVKAHPHELTDANGAEDNIAQSTAKLSRTGCHLEKAKEKEKAKARRELAFEPLEIQQWAREARRPMKNQCGLG